MSMARSSAVAAAVTKASTAVTSGSTTSSWNSMAMLHDMRTPYKSNREAFLETGLPTKNPFELFDRWFQDAKEKLPNGFEEINAFCLSTVGKDNKPSSRVVLLKSYSPAGFTFFTNYSSRKGEEIAANNNVAAVFYWPFLNRQIRIEGTICKLPKKEAEEYWAKRPVGSQLAGFMSQQSRPVASREYMEKMVQEVKAEYVEKGLPVPMPTHWGGYRIAPVEFEFWQGQTDRLHDRIRFRRECHREDTEYTQKGAEGWAFERLQP